MKSIIELGVLVVIAGLLVFCYGRSQVENPSPPPALVSSQGGPTIEKLQRLSSLVTSRVYVVDVLIGESENARGAWLIRGDGLLAIDLNRASITDKSEELKKATIVLPEPEVLQARVDHEKTKTWEVKSTSWVPWRSDQDQLRDEVFRQAQRLVAQAAGSRENIDQAKRAAEAIIAGLYEQLGWELTIIWKDSAPAQPANEATDAAQSQ